MTPISLGKFCDRITDLFPQVARGIARYENNRLTQGTITLPQVWVLHYLVKRKTSSMCDLAAYMRLGFSSATGLVDRLVKQGLVARYRSQKDRRMVYVGITAKGKSVLKQIFTQKRKGLLELFRALTLKERNDYLKILEKLAAQLSHSKEKSKELL